MVVLLKSTTVEQNPPDLSGVFFSKSGPKHHIKDQKTTKNNQNNTKQPEKKKTKNNNKQLKKTTNSSQQNYMNTSLGVQKPNKQPPLPWAQLRPRLGSFKVQRCLVLLGVGFALDLLCTILLWFSACEWHSSCSRPKLETFLTWRFWRSFLT